MNDAKLEEKLILVSKNDMTNLVNFNDDDDDELFLKVWFTDERCLALFSAGTIVRDPHHLKPPTCQEQDLNLCRT